MLWKMAFNAHDIHMIINTENCLRFFHLQTERKNGKTSLSTPLYRVAPLYHLLVFLARENSRMAEERSIFPAKENKKIIMMKNYEQLRIHAKKQTKKKSY